MFIRETVKLNKTTNKSYTYHTILENKRFGDQTKQNIILNLGATFTLEKNKWDILTDRIDTILSNQQLLFLPPDDIEILAQSLAAKIRNAQLDKKDRHDESGLKEFSAFDQLTVRDCCHAGVALISLWAQKCLGFPEIFDSLNFTDEQKVLAMTTIAARMEYQSSELGTFKWLKSNSAICELLGHKLSLKYAMQLYRISDILVSNFDKIENQLSIINSNLLSASSKCLIFDLTNVYFEGTPKSPKAARGHSKEKRSDCLLESLASFVDSSGYVRKCTLFPGNISEPATLKSVLEQLDPPKSTVLVMDRGVATAANIEWLHLNGYKYIVANREQKRYFDPSLSIPIRTKSGGQVSIYKQEKALTFKGKQFIETRILCHSLQRQNKEEGINNKRTNLFESGLSDLHNAIVNSKSPVSAIEISKKLGALSMKCKVKKHYIIKLEHPSTDGNIDKTTVTGLSYEFKAVQNTMMTHPGVYSIRTNIDYLSDQEIWENYIDENIIESVFRSLKSELGLRPIFHWSEDRIDGHLLISILAYQCVNWIRINLKSINIFDRWHVVARKLSTISTYTVEYITSNGVKKKHRKISIPNKEQMEIYKAVGLRTSVEGVFDIGQIKSLRVLSKH
jgi:transposase